MSKFSILKKLEVKDSDCCQKFFGEYNIFFFVLTLGENNLNHGKEVFPFENRRFYTGKVLLL